MKKVLIYLLAISLFMGSTIAFAEGLSIGDEDVYKGLVGYKNIQNKINYKAIDKSFAKSSIIKLFALDIFKGDEANFKPKTNITRRQALTCISRALGLYEEEDIIETLLKLGIITKEEYESITDLSDEQLKRIDENVKKLSEKGKLSKEQISKIKEKEIEKLTWDRNATREEVALWIGRSLGLEGKTPYIVKGFKDYSSFNSQNITLMEAFLQQVNMVGYNDGYFRPKRAITREQFAKILDYALDDLLITIGYQIKEGEIDDIKRITTREGYLSVIQNIYYMKNTDGTYPIIHTSKSPRESLSQGFLVYRRGRLATSEILKVSDEIKYYVNPENNIVYSEFRGIY
ncbi:TPA: S-layer homology domain-containing protein [Clostridioides difficile]